MDSQKTSSKLEPSIWNIRIKDGNKSGLEIYRVILITY